MAAMIEWNDLIRGPQHIDTTGLSDPVLVREDGTYLYTLPSVVDDIDFGITHVIRGEDHVVNTAVQIEITQALGGNIPAYAHHSLLTGADGKGLSKRLGSLSIASMREQGLEAMAVVSHAALLGTSDNIHPCADYSELVDGLRSRQAVARAGPVRRGGTRPPQCEAAASPAVGCREGPARWRHGGVLARHSRQHRKAVGCLDSGPMSYQAPSRRLSRTMIASFIAGSKALLPPEPWDTSTWKTWTDAVKAATGRKGKALFMPLRLALTGLDHGPELAQLLPLIGRQRVLERLS